MTDEPTCNVCNQRESVGVACSSLGPCSWAYCRACLDNNAEPACMIDAALEGMEGVEGLAPWVLATNTWDGERYISITDYAATRSTRLSEIDRRGIA